jgi:hypothetical protein
VSVALVIRHAKGMHRIILSFVACLALPYFSTLSHKRHDFLKKKLLNMKCVFWFSLRLLSETFLILRPSQRDIIINVHRSSRKVPVILVSFNGSWIFSTDFRKIHKHQLSWKSVKWEQSCSMRTDRRTERQTDMTKLTVAFRNFANNNNNNNNFGEERLLNETP